MAVEMVDQTVSEKAVSKVARMVAPKAETKGNSRVERMGKGLVVMTVVTTAEVMAV